MSSPRKPSVPCSAPGCGKPAVAKGYCKAHWHRQHRYGHPLGGYYEEGHALAWLEAHVDHEDGSACLAWPFGCTGGGGAAVKVDGRQRPAARVMCERRHGPAPTPEHEAAHSCGKGHEGCVNPNHLRWATPSENQQDRLIHGTHGRGERGGRATLTEAAVRSIRASTSRGRDLAEQYGVDVSTISAVRRRRTWAWME